MYPTPLVDKVKTLPSVILRTRPVATQSFINNFEIRKKYIEVHGEPLAEIRHALTLAWCFAVTGDDDEGNDDDDDAHTT